MPLVGSSVDTTLTVETSPGSGLYADLTSYLLHGSMVLKLNTLDLALINRPGQTWITGGGAGAGVIVHNPSWTGTIASAQSSDPVELRNSQRVMTLTATNTKALPLDTAPFDLSDVPSASPLFDYLLEDGSGHYLIEDGTDFAPGALLLEGALAKGYEQLSVQVRTNPGGPNKTLGKCRVKVPGLRAGNQFKRPSSNH